MQAFLKELNHLYLTHRAFWSMDCSREGFRWIDYDDRDHNLFSYLRFSDDGGMILCVLNLSGAEWKGSEIGAPEGGIYERILDTDLKRFGGHGRRREKIYRTLPGERHGQAQHLKLNLPPLSAIILERRRNSHE